MTHQRIAQPQQSPQSKNAIGKSESHVAQGSTPQQAEEGRSTSPHDFRGSDFQHDFSRVPIHSNGLMIQPQLKLGAAKDEYEQEADRVAAQVVEHLQTVPQSGQNVAIQRQIKDDEDQEPLRRKPSIGHRVEDVPVSSGLESAISRSRSSGTSIAPAIRQPMERAFGADFRGVKIHTDAQADQFNRSLQARAFTTGSNIFFRRGAYDPGSRSGQELIAHELAHTIQQGAAKRQPTTQPESRSPSPLPQLGNAGIKPPVQNSVAIQRSGTVTDVIQRVPEPAFLREEAGLHKSNRQTAGAAPVTIETGRFSTKSTIPARTAITIDYAKPVVDTTFVWASYNGKEGYIKKKYIDQGQQLQMPTLYARPISAQQFRVFDTQVNDYINDPKTKAPLTMPNEVLYDLDAILGHLLQSEVATGLLIEDKEEIIQQVMKQVALGTKFPDRKEWQQATVNLQAKVIQRVNHDRPDLINAGLITAAHQLKRVKFAGADFHKHSQAPVFLFFEINNPMPDPRTVVYKPGNLDVDAQLFGKPRGGIANSLAQDLDPAGTKISQYTILSQQDAATQEKYGFMEFVRSDGPVTATDLLSVYESLAANMALSYLVGLEDVHQENVLLLRDRIQVIDMEATTGRFGVSRTPGGVDVTQGGFKAQLWTKALAEGIRPKLEARARNRQLQAVPSTGTAAISMASTFLRVIRQAEGVGFNGQWLAHTQALAGFTSRIVPITTEDFYRAILPARRVGSYSQWLLYLNGDPADPEHQTPATAKGNWLVAQACAFTHANIDFARRVLASPGAYNALNRGEVPYFTRDLNTSNQIMDEEGNAIPVNPGDISKIGSAIDTEMDTRRNALQSGRQEKSDVLAIFSAQIIQYIQQLNDDLLRLLRPARRRP